MKILVINCGSSSLKFDFHDLAEGMIDGIGLKSCRFTFTSKDKNIGQTVAIKDHHEALQILFETLKKSGVIKNYNEIDAVGHRVVHGGEKYSESVKLDAKIIKELEKLIPLAPLHNPANLAGIQSCKKLLPKTPQVAVFDTAFHQTMPKTSYIYGLPYELYEKHGIRRYGFHGTSHKYVINEALRLLKKKKAKIISCHLGNGSSIAAFDGKILDTSMGFTPLEGVLMGTRSGSIDPAIIFHLHRELKMKLDEIEKLLLLESGLKGLSKVSSDMRKVYEASLKKDALAQLAIDTFSYQIAKYCGAYTATLNGLEALVFTAGIGEHAFYVREKICAHLEFLGLKLNPQKNKNCELEISDTKSKIKVFVIPTNEQLQIAKETEKVLKG